MRILFAGSPEIAVNALQALHERFEVVAVLTNPDRKKGRGKKVQPTAVAQRAIELGLPVLSYDHLYGEARREVASYKPEVLVTFAYGRIFGPRFLSLFPSGAINVHPSLLPTYRGCAPIQAAIENGDSQTGITIQRIALKTDEGDILSQQIIELDGTETTESLSRRVSELCVPQLLSVLDDLAEDRLSPVVQDHSRASYCYMIEKSQAPIDWKEPAFRVSSKIRSFYPWPKASTVFHDRQLSICYATLFDDEVPGVGPASEHLPGTVVAAVAPHGLITACGNGYIGIKRLQLQSKKEMDYKSFVNGNPDIIGSVLGV